MIKKLWNWFAGIAVGLFNGGIKAKSVYLMELPTPVGVSIADQKEKMKEISMRSEKFEKLIGFVLDHEGREYENVPNDPGGETKFGISKKSFSNLDIKNLTEEQAKDIYFNEYWLPLDCDNYPDKLALAILDSGVNCGVETAKKWLPEELTPEDFLYKRLRRYANLCQQNPKLNTFLLGWLIRVLHIIERY